MKNIEVINSSLSRAIRKERLRKNMSRLELSQQIGMSPQELLAIETQPVRVPANSLVVVIEQLGLIREFHQILL